MISIIIPAHNEASVIRRTLHAMTVGADAAEVEIIVVCNGSTDDTAAIARQFGPIVRVVETDLAGKAHALNLGDAAAHGFPRIYSDADVVLSMSAIKRLAGRLSDGDVLVVAPISEMDLAGCSWAVRAYYSIRSLLPSGREGIGGSGVYALSQAGRARFAEFPSVTADDGYVRIQFQPDERETLWDVSSKVFAPRTLKNLIATKTRSHYGSLELARRFPTQWKNRGESNRAPLKQLFKQSRFWPKLSAYCFVTLVAKSRAKKLVRRGNFKWLRDETARVAAEINLGNGSHP